MPLSAMLSMERYRGTESVLELDASLPKRQHFHRYQEEPVRKA